MAADAETGRRRPAKRARGRKPHQLPAGRHGLPHSYVERNQRERILSAVVSVATRTGYAGLTVRDVIARAGVSRRTFYEHFENKGEALLSGCDLVIDRLVSEVEEAARGGDSWTERVRLGLRVFLDRLAAEPGLAHLCVVETLSTGPLALSRHGAAKESFRVLLEPKPGETPGDQPLSPLAAEAAIGGAYEVVCARVLDGRTAELPGLMPELLQLLVLPFVGAETAAAEAAAARSGA